MLAHLPLTSFAAGFLADRGQVSVHIPGAGYACPRVLIETQIVGLHSGLFDFRNLWRGLRICISRCKFRELKFKD